MPIIDKFSRQPIYEQLIESIEREILTGVLPAGARVPSVRELSVSLCVNPNTVQKALSELDRAGVIVSAKGRGSFVAEDAEERILLHLTPQLDELKRLVRRLALSGVAEGAITAAVRAAIDGAKNEKGETNDDKGD